MCANQNPILMLYGSLAVSVNVWWSLCWADHCRTLPWNAAAPVSLPATAQQLFSERERRQPDSQQREPGQIQANSLDYPVQHFMDAAAAHPSPSHTAPIDYGAWERQINRNVINLPAARPSHRCSGVADLVDHAFRHFHTAAQNHLAPLESPAACRIQGASFPGE